MIVEEVTKFIPHRQRMVLIDEIENISKEEFIARVNITTDSLLYTEAGVPSYCGIEYMAQAIAAYNTIYYTSNQKIKIGFIVSVRNFQTQTTHFKFGDQLEISVIPVLIVQNSGSFTCTITCNNEEVASARITAYVPTEEELELLKKECYGVQ